MAAIHGTATPDGQGPQSQAVVDSRGQVHVTEADRQAVPALLLADLLAVSRDLLREAVAMRLGMIAARTCKDVNDKDIESVLLKLQTR